MGNIVLPPSTRAVIPVGNPGGTVKSGGNPGAPGVGGAPPSYVPQSRLRAYDATRNVYNFKASNTTRLRAGLGRAAATSSSPTHHLFIGDSLTAGCIQGAHLPPDYDRLNAWPMAARAEVARHGVAVNGTGYVRTIDSTLGSDSRWTYTGTWVGVSAYGFSVTGGSTATFRPNVADTTYTLWYYDIGGAGGATLGTVAIDGAVSGASFRTLTSTTTAGWKRATLIAAAAITTSSTIVHTANANGLYFGAGMVWTPGGGGMIASNLGQSGSRAQSGTGYDSWSEYVIANNGLGGVYQNMGAQARTVTDAVLTASSATMTSATASFSANKDLGSPVRIDPGVAGIYLPAGTFISAVGSSTSVTLSQNALISGTGLTARFDIDPEVVHVELGGNDLSNGSAASTITAALTTIRNTYANSDVILYASNQPASSLVANATFDSYVAALYDLADTLDVPLFDMRDRFGTYAQQLANGLLGDSAVHLRASGYADWGRNVGMTLAG